MFSPYLGFASMSMRKQSSCMFTTKFCCTPGRIACSEVQLDDDDDDEDDSDSDEGDGSGGN